MSPEAPANHTSIHINSPLHSILLNRSGTEYKKPFSPFSLSAFKTFQKFYSMNPGKKIILDSGCGVGMSTCAIARENPDAIVLGVDKSAARLMKSERYLRLFEKEEKEIRKRVCLVRAELIDIWRLMLKESISVSKHYILYPNPYPKKSQIKKRWYAHPVFPDLLKLCGQIELRSNIESYVLDFKNACLLRGKYGFNLQSLDPSSYMSPFEKKYDKRGQVLWKLTLNRFSDT